ncbi:MAG: hypothetical protein KC442_00450 [Thermomicrobiales bacterium]|nr:hypothetical protein [Thermomicrobiales bacterium]
MALTTIPHDATAAELRAEARRVAEEMLQPPAEAERAYEEMVTALRASIARYEERFGLPSEDVGTAINAGILIEDLDVCDWLLHYKRLKRLGGC